MSPCRFTLLEMQSLRRLVVPAIAVRPNISHPTPAFPFVTASLRNSAPHHFIQPHSNSTITMAATDATLRAFFQSPKFAVVGASTNTDKFGYKGQSCALLCSSLGSKLSGSFVGSAYADILSTLSGRGKLFWIHDHVADMQ